MTFDRLTWRIGLPFTLLVLVTTAALTWALGEQVHAEERSRFEQMATSLAQFLSRSGYRISVKLAGELRVVTGYRVGFRSPNESGLPERLLGEDANGAPLPLPAGFRQLVADGRAVRHGDTEFVAVPVPFDEDLVLARHVRSPLWQPRILQVLAAFWLLAFVTAWLVGRGLVRPLRQLAAELPNIERPGALHLPAASRRDEIGDLARAFVATAAALQRERDERQRVEKLAVLGRMTAALAHEVLNPVAAIRMHAQLWRREHGAEPADTIDGEASRIEGLLSQWLFLTRPEPPALAPIDTAALLRELVVRTRPQAEHAGVQITVAFAEPVSVQADRRRLEQVFRNLINNAIQAMPHGGRLTIHGQQHDGRLRIAFDDDGTGFSPGALAHFGEFFYTEREGGMGIGLCVVQEILRAHGGSVVAQNRPGGGASVTVELPSPATTA